MTKVFDARAKITDPVPGWDEYVEKLETWKDDAEKARARLEQQAEETRSAAKGCADLDQYYEILTVASDVLDLSKAPFDLTIGFWKSKAVEDVAEPLTET